MPATLRHSCELSPGLFPTTSNSPVSNEMLRWFEKSVMDSRGDDSSEDATVSIAQLIGLEKPSVSVAPSNVESTSVMVGVNSIDADRFRAGALLPRVLRRARERGAGERSWRLIAGNRNTLSDVGRSRGRRKRRVPNPNDLIRLGYGV